MFENARVGWTTSAAILAGVCLFWVGCSDSRVAKLTPSGATPAAEGTVTSRQGENGNTHLEVTVNYLAPPQKIAKNAAVYVVWATPPAGSKSQNIGALKVGEGRSGMLDTTTPLTDFDLRITPESAATVEAPSGEAVLTGHVQLK